ncbi:hypothetical protein EXN66_Car000834 [Channa argus]|uniref:Uncharacterized protein n=1 Tax=Channa argus TaxID=215402 RepID=A0A6G1QY85_CHAAH|nr:hypothetical protein EXN66_Car000834 [Channa argus]
MDSDRQEKGEGGKQEHRESERKDGGMPACLSPGPQMILVVSLLHHLCADPL